MPDPLGRACIFPGDRMPCVTVVDVCIVRPGDGVERRWLVHQLNAPSFRQQLGRFINGTTRQRVSRTNLGQLLVDAPSLHEQRRIADILDKADAVRRRRKEAIALTEELLRSAFLEMFGDPVTNPKGWELRKVGDLLRESRSGATVRPEDFRRSGFPVLHKGGIKPCGRILLDPDKNTYVDEGFARSNASSVVGRDFVVITLRDLVPTGPSIGLASSLEFAERAAYLLVERVYGVILNRAHVVPEYFVWLSNDRRFRHRLAAMAVGATQVHIRRADYNNMVIPVPPVERQMDFRRLVHAVARLDGHLGHAATSNEALFRSLTHHCFVDRRSTASRERGAERCEAAG
jgi:type I restriction enzyme S subunit